MTVDALIQRLHDSGIHVDVDGDRLHVQAPTGAVTTDLRTLLTNRKADIIEAMSGIRGRLLALARGDGLDAALVYQLPDVDIEACSELADDALRAFLDAAQAAADRKASRIPDRCTTAIVCRSCGPVWVSPDVARALPQVDGWPRALGCPWCFNQTHGLTIPRPRVTCAQCRHWIPDTINPAGGMGRCDACNKFAAWPGQKHTCDGFDPTNASTPEPNFGPRV